MPLKTSCSCRWRFPVFIEVTPDEFKPAEERSRDELLAAAERLMGSALIGAREAVDHAEEHGDKTPIDHDMMDTSKTNMMLAEALVRYAETR